jgi:hypothetical protein
MQKTVATPSAFPRENEEEFGRCNSVFVTNVEIRDYSFNQLRQSWCCHIANAIIFLFSEASVCGSWIAGILCSNPARG